ncbi:hypothetical protein NXW92_07665 [Bacteroides fragilis]|nr:hypothetical protein [Bacteroides fragilis]
MKKNVSLLFLGRSYIFSRLNENGCGVAPICLLILPTNPYRQKQVINRFSPFEKSIKNEEYSLGIA